ncbi:MAG: type II toxin-antitoxin system PemK/MazF family toxin [bacterium]|nr:type II toxin-antitoxin system PemK/MazF family toxin [bacterium]
MDQIRTISKLRLIKRIDSLSEADAKNLRLLISEMYGEESAGS